MNARHTRPSHQTVRLDRGKHLSAESGVCVMELASMLAGERFSDRPRAVCPVVAAFARGYNDAVDYERRQELFAWASRAVGSRSYDANVKAERELLLHAAAMSVRAQLPLMRRLGVMWRALREPPWEDLERERFASVLSRELAHSGGHELAEQLFGKLLAVRPADGRPTVAARANDELRTVLL